MTTSFEESIQLQIINAMQIIMNEESKKLITTQLSLLIHNRSIVSIVLFRIRTITVQIFRPILTLF